MVVVVLCILLVWMCLVALACDSLHVCTVCIWQLEQPSVCVDVFKRHIIFFFF